MYRNITYVVYQELTCVVGHVYLKKKKERKKETNSFVLPVAGLREGVTGWRQ